MATDAFTNTNGVALSAHVAGGNTWAGCGQADANGEILNNTVVADASDFFTVSARATNSSSDYSSILFKGGAYDSESKTVNVRSSATTPGYYMQVYEVTADNITLVTLRKGDEFLSGFSASINRLVDHTFAIKATAVAGGVELRGWIDGSPVTWNETDANTATPSQVFTDLTAQTPLPAGNPGFVVGFYGTIGPTNSGMDTWTDTEPSAAAVLSSPTPSGTLGTQTTATIGATTNQSSGNFYVVVDTSGNLAGVTASQIKAGQNAASGAAFKSGDVPVSTTSPSVGVTGLGAGTSYAYAAIQNNANGDTNIVTGTFTTAAAVAASGTPGGVRSRIATLMLT